MRSLRRRSELVQTHLLCTAAIVSFHVGDRCQGYGGETVVTDSRLGDRWQGYGGETVVMATATKQERIMFGCTIIWRLLGTHEN